jgi:hypothetical protein
MRVLRSIIETATDFVPLGRSTNLVHRVKDLIGHIDAFIAAYNQTAKPFLWTKSKVHQKRLRPCFAD